MSAMVLGFWFVRFRLLALSACSFVCVNEINFREYARHSASVPEKPHAGIMENNNSFKLVSLSKFLRLIQVASSTSSSSAIEGAYDRLSSSSHEPLRYSMKLSSSCNCAPSAPRMRFRAAGSDNGTLTPSLSVGVLSFSSDVEVAVDFGLSLGTGSPGLFSVAAAVPKSLRKSSVDGDAASVLSSAFGLDFAERRPRPRPPPARPPPRRTRGMVRHTRACTQTPRVTRRARNKSAATSPTIVDTVCEQEIFLE